MHKRMEVSLHPFMLIPRIYLVKSVQQICFQIGQHGVQGLNAAGGSVPDVGVLDEVDDLALLVAAKLLD